MLVCEPHSFHVAWHLCPSTFGLGLPGSSSADEGNPPTHWRRTHLHGRSVDIFLFRSARGNARVSAHFGAFGGAQGSTSQTNAPRTSPSARSRPSRSTTTRSARACCAPRPSAGLRPRSLTSHDPTRDIAGQTKLGSCAGMLGACALARVQQAVSHSPSRQHGSAMLPCGQVRRVRRPFCHAGTSSSCKRPR